MSSPDRDTDLREEERSTESQASNLSDFVEDSSCEDDPTPDQGSGISIQLSNPTLGYVSVLLNNHNIRFVLYVLVSV